LTVVPFVISNDEIKEGVFKCDECSDIVGVIEDFKFDFIHFMKSNTVDKAIKKSNNSLSPIIQKNKYKTEDIFFFDQRLQYIGNWTEQENEFMLSWGTSVEDKISIKIKCSDIELFFFAHAWSGKVKISVDNKFFEIFDLYNPQGCLRKLQIKHKLAYHPHLIEIIPLCTKNDASVASQVVFKKIRITTNELVPDRYIRKAKNLGNPYPERFLELIKSVPENGMILDCGGGNRQLNDKRYINLEYLKFELPDAFANAHNLPFKNNSFDLILSQAVLEHMYNPFQAVKELHRVLKVDGIIWAEMAFMQPLHAVPHHYFNFTEAGARELFKEFEEPETGWFGKISETFEWILSDLNVEKNIGEKKYKNLMKTLHEIDQYVSYENLKNAASGVYFCGRK
jgi:ubiquinone/menaquinone biosynthesis C-methylase UbiE